MRVLLLLGIATISFLLVANIVSGEQGQVANCPLANKWSIATWDGPSGTSADSALGTCGQGEVIAAYWLEPESQSWLRYIAGRPELSTLNVVDRGQGLLVLGSSEAPTTPIPEAGQPIRFTGSGDKDSEDFRISGNQFTVSWTVESETPDSVALGIFIYPAGETISYVGHASFYEVGADSTVVRAGPGDFYLSVLSANCDWAIEVKE